MINYLIPVHVFLLVMTVSSIGKTTVEDCREHDSRCQEHCFEIYNNVKIKSDITEKYLKKCRGICIRRKESCVERARELELLDKSKKPADITSAIDEVSQSTENYPRTPNRIYKYRDDTGQLHVVDDINKIPRKYRPDISE